MAHIRQSRPDSGLGVQVKVCTPLQGDPSSRGEGQMQPIENRVENYYFTEMCSGSEAGSHLRLIDIVYHSALGLRVIKKKKK